MTTRKSRIRTRRGAPWTIAELNQLGKTPDSVLAKRFTRTIREIVEEREARGMGLPVGLRRWTAREIKLLGTMNDAELGRRLRRSKEQVRRQRWSFKIPPFQPPQLGKPWKPREIKLLGTLRDKDLARRLKRSKCSVEIMRIRLGIPVFARTNRLYAPAEDAVIRKYSVAEAARRIGRGKYCILARRRAIGVAKTTLHRPWTEKEVALLGTVPDLELARRLNRTKGSIVDKRNQLRIYRYRNRPGYGAWKGIEDALLGKFADSEVARRLGRPKRVVRRRRNKLGIPSFWMKREWTAAETALPGKLPDQVVAEKLVRPAKHVMLKRRALRIFFRGFNPVTGSRE